MLIRGSNSLIKIVDLMSHSIERINIMRLSIFFTLRLFFNSSLLLLDFDFTLTIIFTLSFLLFLFSIVYNSRLLFTLFSVSRSLIVAQLFVVYVFDLKAHESFYLSKKFERKDLTQKTIYQRSYRLLKTVSFARDQQVFFLVDVIKSNIHFVAFNALSSEKMIFRKD